jgi:hypothetical protein
MPLYLGHIEGGAIQGDLYLQQSNVCKTPYEYNTTNFIGYGDHGQYIYRAPDNCGGESFEVIDGNPKGYSGPVYGNDPRENLPIISQPTESNSPPVSYPLMEMFSAPTEVSSSTENTGVVPPIHQRGGAGGLVAPAISPQEATAIDQSTDAFLQLLNENNLQSRTDMISGMMKQWLIGATLGAMAVKSAIHDQQFDAEANKLIDSVTNLKPVAPMPLPPRTFIPQISETYGGSDHVV